MKCRGKVSKSVSAKFSVAKIYVEYDECVSMLIIGTHVLGGRAEMAVFLMKSFGFLFTSSVLSNDLF